MLLPLQFTLKNILEMGVRLFHILLLHIIDTLKYKYLFDRFKKKKRGKEKIRAMVLKKKTETRRKPVILKREMKTWPAKN